MAMDGPRHSTPVATAVFYPNRVASNGGKDETSREMKVTKVIAGMEGGDGEFSYTRNSRLQSQAINLLEPILKQEISELNFDNWQDTARLADFGCSLGANTLQYAEICFQSVQESCRTKSERSPDVQCFFCDLPSNDFNTLFRQLEDWRMSRTSNPGIADNGERKRFYASAVPGSFYGRLFPQRSLHVAISTFAVQWMSQVPDAVLDKDSAAYNKGRVWIDGIENPAVLEAFALTARQDLRNFLLSRADEVISGGFVLILMPGRLDDSHPEIQWAKEGEYSGPYSKVFEETWNELVLEGVIEEERRDSFNVPIYLHSVDEVRAVAESTNAYNIKRLEITQQAYFSPNEVEQILADPQAYGQFMKDFTKSMVNSYIVKHIGEKNTHELFERLERNAATAARERKFSSLPINLLLAILVRK